MKEKIKQYLLGDLEGEALKAFEEQLSQDHQLKADVQQKETLLEKHIQEGVEHFSELQEMILNIHKEAQKEEKNKEKETPIRTLKPKIGIKKWLAVAATIAFFVIGYLLYNPSSTPEQLIAQWNHTIPTELPLTTMGAADDIEQLEAEAEQFFLNKDYEKTKQLCNQILAINPAQTTALFARGVCELHLKNYEAAIQDFETIEATKVVFKTQATWLKGISYLKKGDVFNCKKIMQELANNENASEKNASVKEIQDAKKLLKQIQKMN